MTPPDVQSAAMQLYEDPSLTDELTDGPAKMLLQWAEKQLPALAARHSDDAAFEEAAKTLRGLIKTINRFTGQRATMSSEEQAETLQKFVDRAAALGFKAQAAHMSAYLAQQGALSEQENVNALLRWAETGTTASGPTADNSDLPAPLPVEYPVREQRAPTPVDSASRRPAPPPPPRPADARPLDDIPPVDRPSNADEPSSDY